MKINRIMIAAPKSGSGKTLLTCALLQALKDRGEPVVSYKCGPDYIDPMFHQKVMGVPSKNLDTFFTDERQTRDLFLQGRKEGDFAVMEGVMGLYDGLGGIRQEGSSYHLAQITETPIILVVDAKGMGRSVISLIAGFLAYDRAHLIRGVILNRISSSYYGILKPLIEEELQIRVVGYFPEAGQFHIESRHLGLWMPDELQNIRERLREAGEQLQKTVSVDLLLRIAKQAEETEWLQKLPDASQKPEADGTGHATVSGMESGTGQDTDSDAGVVLAVARDEAFCFYYEDNLRLLRENGGSLQFFSPLHDSALPKDCCGILLGGGYPELYGKELEQNESMRMAIRKAASNGIPMVAECGGFMYLHSIILDQKQNSSLGAGVLPKTCYATEKLVRFGYISLEEKNANFLPEGTTVRGHEFHYFDSEDNGADCIATKPVTGRTYSCVISEGNRWMGFPHLYYPSNPAFPERFVEKAREYQRKKEREANGEFI